MKDHYSKVREYVLELGHTISSEHQEDGVLVIEDELNGIKNLVIGCADPLLIMEQYIFELKEANSDVLKSLLNQYGVEVDHPMTEVLRQGLTGVATPRRRGGWRSRPRN